eukprot:scaffold3394_cov385-Prasinococcus_capsulatus_cf.AAC.6
MLVQPFGGRRPPYERVGRNPRGDSWICLDGTSAKQLLLVHVPECMAALGSCLVGCEQAYKPTRERAPAAALGPAPRHTGRAEVGRVPRYLGSPRNRARYGAQGVVTCTPNSASERPGGAAQLVRHLRRTCA